MGNGNYTRECPRMMKLNYSCTFEKEANQLLSQCLTADPKHDNVNWFIASKDNKKEAAEEALKAWYDEITRTGAHMLQTGGSRNLLLPDLKITHFARMVWGTNTQVGCAFKRCDAKWQVVCKYDTGVGVPGNPIYRIGPNCNQCRDNCDGGLCLK
ncbi:SCP-like protein [Ancylostoma caninum]|uniref:SCP-like protein n=1 Tax=Ancylostoma caninum TaxID=29170 RepID=A0A368GRC5_ANCCA|nr:SCP-like protein [Ancylostoma caninum]